MMGHIFTYFLILVVNANLVFGQEWSAPCFFNSPVIAIEPSEEDSVLYFAGLFSSVDNTLNVFSVARYNGESFSTVNQSVMGEIPFPGIPQSVNIKSFGDRLYFEGLPGGGFPVINLMEGDTVNSNFLVFENGSWHKWDIAWTDDPENSWNNRTACMEVIDNELWVISYKQEPGDPLRWVRVQPDGSIDHYEIAASDNEVVGEIKGTISGIVKWNEDYYLSGRFYQVNEEGTSSTQVHILKWDGVNTFEYLPQAFYGGLLTSIHDLAVYEGKLIVAGTFSVSESGSPSNFIMTWDGSEWAPLFGNGTNGAVSELKVIGDILFFSGSFNQLFRDEGIYGASRIAYYDGGEAYRISDKVIDWDIRDFEVYQGQLLVAGYISSIQLQTFGHIARFEGTLPVATGLADESVQGFISIYPNPCSENCRVNISGQGKGGVLMIFDSRGALVNEIIVAPQTQTIEISSHNGLDPGVYFVRFHEGGDAVYNTKMIVGL